MIASKKDKKTLEKHNRLFCPTTPSNFSFSGCLGAGAIFLESIFMATYTKETVIMNYSYSFATTVIV